MDDVSLFVSSLVGVIDADSWFMGFLGSEVALGVIRASITTGAFSPGPRERAKGVEEVGICVFLAASPAPDSLFSVTDEGVMPSGGSDVLASCGFDALVSIDDEALSFGGDGTTTGGAS